MKASVGSPFYSDFNVDQELDWQMTRAEKYCLINLLKTLHPEVAIEIGTYKGGSLQVINKYSQKVYSIDISPAPKKFLEQKFPDVTFKIAEADKIIHEICKEIDDKGKKLEFILVDGDHTKIGVRRDLEAILSYPHKHPLTILLHDSFNPQCRKGIKTVDYSKYPAVEYVELDYITGAFWHNDTYREMWGGFGMIRVNPLKKEAGVVINESQKRLFRHTRIASIHLIKDRLRFLAPVKQFLYKKLGKKHKSEIYDNF